MSHMTGKLDQRFLSEKIVFWTGRSVGDGDGGGDDVAISVTQIGKLNFCIASSFRKNEQDTRSKNCSQSISEHIIIWSTVLCGKK